MTLYFRGLVPVDRLTLISTSVPIYPVPSINSLSWRRWRCWRDVVSHWGPPADRHYWLYTSACRSLNTAAIMLSSITTSSAVRCSQRLQSGADHSTLESSEQEQQRVAVVDPETCMSFLFARCRPTRPRCAATAVAAATADDERWCCCIIGSSLIKIKNNSY